MISRRVFRSVGDGGRAWQESRRQTLSLGGLLESRGVGDTVQEEAVRVLQRCGFVATHELTSFMSSQVRSVDGACHGHAHASHHGHRGHDRGSSCTSLTLVRTRHEA